MKSLELEKIRQNIEFKCIETKEHTDRMVALAIKMSEILNLNKEDTECLVVATELHDIGKNLIPDEILYKVGKITDVEYEIIKSHSQYGYDIIAKAPELKEIAELVLLHHERWDGSGYPKGIKGNEIPFLARLINLIDSYDAMTHESNYKPPKTKQEAIEEIERNIGRQFDPELAVIFLQLIKNQ